MRRPSFLASALALLVVEAADATRELGEGEAAAVRRGGGLGDGGASSHEFVSSEPLSFEVAPPEPVDRARLLAEAEEEEEEDAPREDFVVMEGMELFEGEEVWTTADADGSWDEGVEGDEEYFDYSEDNDGYEGEYVDYGEDEGADYGYGEAEEFDYGYEMDEGYVGGDYDFTEDEGADYGEDEANEDGPSFDSTYDSENGDEFFVREEGDEVGEPLGFEEPIVRRLRRVTPSARREQDEERRLAEKEKLRDEYESAPLFEPAMDENGEFDLTPYAEPEYLEELGQLSAEEHDGRDLQQKACGANQKRIQVEILTDKSPWETSWTVKNAKGVTLIKGPPGKTKYAKQKRYIGKLCLNPGTYTFTVSDKFRDGMCGANSGRGLYRFYIAGAKKFTSPAKCSQNWAKRTHKFTIQRPNNSRPTNSRPTNNRPTNSRPTNNNNKKPANNNNNKPANNNNNAIAGRGGCHNVKIQFKVDKFGKETTVRLSGGGRTHLESVRNVGAYQTKTLTKCVPPGTYTLRLTDQDGICCKNGKGFYKMFVGGQQVIGGGYFVGSKTHTIKIGSNWRAAMTARDRQWLDGHNSRRRKYNGGKGYRALRWSRTLKADALAYAKKLANNCNGPLVHAKGIQDGENLAKNKGSGQWGRQYPVENIMRRFVENELKWPYPKNAHYTQVVWRATQYVGCGEAVKAMANRQTCRVQVCRYARAGNCNVRNGNWRAEAWKDETQCGRACPREGCFV